MVPGFAGRTILLVPWTRVERPSEATMTQLTDAPDAPAEAQSTWYAIGSDAVAAELGVNPAEGLSSAEAAERMARYGPNKFAEGKTEPRWRAFVRQYRDPMQVVLLVAGIGSIVPLAQYGTGLVLRPTS
jgi:P-type Ca2+ transporter type 2C